ncbi:MAG: hypothetical protein WAT66_12995 [Actinomycetota bacterium]
MKRRADPILEDLRTLGHEAGHGVAVVVLGARLIRIVAHRNSSDGDSRGFVEYLPDHLTPWQEAFVALAGIACGEGAAVLVNRNTADEREALELVGDVAVLDEVRRAVYRWSLRRDVTAMVRALSGALMDAPDATLPGLPAEQIVRTALAQHRTQRFSRPA